MRLRTRIGKWLWTHIGQPIYDFYDQLLGALVVILCATVLYLILVMVHGC